ILANTAARRECLRHLGADVRGARSVAEIAMNLVHQVFSGELERAALHEASRGMLAERLLDPDITRLHPESTGIEMDGAHWPARITQPSPHPLPRRRSRLRPVAHLPHLDTHFGQHLEAIVRQIVFETGNEIAERIDVF